jgi:tripartite-type tricarboxylate transporter receptor subunit TctC
MKLASLLASILALVSLAAGAQNHWPEKPVHIIVPFTAGSATDIIARTVGEPLSKALGQPVIIENRGGAGGTLGASQVAKSAPDGYTFLVHSAGHVSNPWIYSHLSYDTLKDFAGVTPLASLPNVLIAAPAKGFRDVHDLVDRARAQPGSFNYGSAGTGSATHMNAELFRLSADFDAVHVPFRGTPEALTETAAGRLDFFFAPLASALPFIRDGRVKALAVGTARRSPLLPDVPTTVEAGFKGSAYTFWVAMLAPVGTPRPIVERMNAEVVRILATPDMKQKLAALGAEPMPMAPAAFDGFVREETARMQRVVKNAKIPVQ